jgi:disulfide bond formation protein DsbB
MDTFRTDLGNGACCAMTVSTKPIAAEATSTPGAKSAVGWSVAALAVALAGLAGSLTLSLGMALKACPLCFYQRTFMMSLVAVLGMGLVLGAGRTARLLLLCVPLAVAGLGVALFHVSLEITGKLECPTGLMELGTAPQQSLAVYTVLAALLVLGAASTSAGLTQWGGLAVGVVLGGLLAVASCISNPPMPAPPTRAYAAPPDICRPPFVAP